MALAYGTIFLRNIGEIGLAVRTKIYLHLVLKIYFPLFSFEKKIEKEVKIK
jgi:hypothetical protein